LGFLGAVFHATQEIETGRPTDVHIGDSIVMISSTAERHPFPAFLYLYVDDADAYAYERAMKAGATSIEEPTDTPYGHRRSMFSDAFGNVYRLLVPSTSRSKLCRRPSVLGELKCPPLRTAQTNAWVRPDNPTVSLNFGWARYGSAGTSPWPLCDEDDRRPHRPKS
jgi:PhnB protein